MDLDRVFIVATAISSNQPLFDFVLFAHSSRSSQTFHADSYIYRLSYTTIHIFPSMLTALHTLGGSNLEVSSPHRTKPNAVGLHLLQGRYAIYVLPFACMALRSHKNRPKPCRLCIGLFLLCMGLHRLISVAAKANM